MTKKKDEEQLSLEHIEDQDNQEEAHGLDELIQEEEGNLEQEAAKREAAEEKAKQLTQAQIEKAKVLAARMNGVFLFAVDKAVCPSVPVSDIVDRAKGDAALLPLAMSWGGEMPDWLERFLEQYQPYIAAGVYMGTTIYTARRVEIAIRQQAEDQAKQEQQDGNQEAA